MKICHIIIGLNVGGAEHMLRRLCIYVHRNKKTFYEQVVISLTDIGVVGKMLEAEGIKIYSLGMRRSLFDVNKIRTLYKLLKTLKPDIIQTWMYHADLVGGVIGRLVGCKNIIWGIRSTDIMGASKATQGIQWMCARLSNIVPKIIICAATASREAHVLSGYVAHKMRVIPNGFNVNELHIDEEKIALLRTTLNINTKTDIVVGMVSRFNAAKDFPNFINAASIVASQIPQVKFLLVGRGCSQKNIELMKWISKTEMNDHFMLLDESKDIASCMAVMNIFCLSSYTEGFPNVLAEAMIMKKLCVSTNAGDAEFLLGDCGVVVPKRNALALANGILKMINLTSKEASVLSSRAKDRILHHFTIDVIAKHFEDVYCELVELQTC